MDWDKQPQRPPGSGNIQDLEEILRRLKDRFKLSSFSRGPFWIVGLVIVLLVIGLNSYYTVDPEETAVVQRFGKFIYTRDAGLHFKVPFGVDLVRKVITGRVLQKEYGYRTVQPGVRSRFAEKGFEEEAVMLSGDLNVVNLQWTVQYKVQNPEYYVFQVRDVEGTLDDISESVVRRIVGNRYADEVLTVGRASVAEMARHEIQEILDSYKSGLQIVTVKLQNANPPDPVKAAFNEVNEARQEKERMINDAQEAYNQKIPKAMGEARQTITQAEGYALERVNRSQGDASRFHDILAEYQKAPEVTRRRMYLESFGDFIGNVDRLFVIDGQQRNLLPLLDLNKLGTSETDQRSQTGIGSQTRSPREEVSR
jgi:membrane protease subunit HflK